MVVFDQDGVLYDVKNKRKLNDGLTTWQQIAEVIESLEQDARLYQQWIKALG